MQELPDTQPLALPEMAELWQQTIDWQPTETQQAQFQRLYAEVLAGNRQLNLTRITHPEEFWEKHLWDSLRGIRQFLQPVSPLADSATTVIDIGTGAGFPGIPIALVQPEWKVTLLDSTRKKMRFLEQLVQTLGIHNAVPWVDRVEQLGQQRSHREQYDLALVRAVSAAAVCAEYALPLLKVGGVAVLYRGQWTPEETIAFEPVVRQLGGTIEAIDAFKTPLTHGDRHCLYLRKLTPTPNAFPRAVGIPAQHPLEGYEVGE